MTLSTMTFFYRSQHIILYKFRTFRHSDATIRIAYKKSHNPHIHDFFFAWELQTSRYPKFFYARKITPAQYTLTRKLGTARETRD